jgi:hypothetical protein
MDRNARPLNEVIVNLLPTPVVSDAASGPGTSGREGGPNLRSAVLLPTPTALADKRGAPSAELAQERMASGRRNLEDAVALLPIPVGGDSTARPSPDGLLF